MKFRPSAGLLIFSAAFGAAEPAAWSIQDTPSVLEVRTEPSGGVYATATLHLPVSPSVVQQVLTDYENWPTLFGVTMRLAHLEQQGERVVTDLYIKHTLLPGERRLLCENQELPGGGLATTLVAGDFKQYSRTWKVVPEGDGMRTRAELELRVDVDTWAPDWLVAVELRRQLEKHFRILRERGEARVRAH
ncbi:MAG: SRPBCC family protein [Nitrospirota bacterium]